MEERGRRGVKYGCGRWENLGVLKKGFMGRVGVV